MSQPQAHNLREICSTQLMIFAELWIPSGHALYLCQCRLPLLLCHPNGQKVHAFLCVLFSNIRCCHFFWEILAAVRPGHVIGQLHTTFSQSRRDRKLSEQTLGARPLGQTWHDQPKTKTKHIWKDRKTNITTNTNSITMTKKQSYKARYYILKYV